MFSIHSFLLSALFSCMALIICFLVYFLRSLTICFSLLLLLLIIKCTWLVIITQACSTMSFFSWQYFKLSTNKSLYCYLLNTSIQPTTEKVTKCGMASSPTLYLLLMVVYFTCVNVINIFAVRRFYGTKAGYSNWVLFTFLVNLCCG